MVTVTEEAALLELRLAILVAMEKASKKSEDGWFYVDAVMDELNKKHVNVDQNRIGNNLRVLKNQGAVDSRRKGRRQWKLINAKHKMVKSVRMTVEFPDYLHAQITKVAKKLNMPKKKFVLDAVQKYLKETP